MTAILRFKRMRTALLLLALIVAPLHASAAEVPMWEGIKKNSAMIAADKEFVAAIEKQYGRKKGAQASLQSGWQFVKSNPDMAIRRFNQAWLLDPSNPNIYWGFAIATHQQGKPLSAVDRYFKRAEKGFAGNRKAIADLHADHGQVYGERGRPADAKKYFLKALQANPKNKHALQGMVAASTQLGDSATARKYRGLLAQ